jgi:predicted DNA-binding transcriptional regulator YafY
MQQLPIIIAIQNQHYFTFSYHGKVRLVEPHKLSTTRLEAYQVFPEPGWRVFKLDEIERAVFETPREGYRPGPTKHIDEVLTEVAA